MSWFSFNYKPKDFKKGDRDKTLPEILEMKPSKIDLDFFTKYAKELEEANLRPETKRAIQFLSDLRNKADIFDKCYTDNQPHLAHLKRAPAGQMHAPHAHAPVQAQAQAPVQAPVQAPAPSDEDDEGQSGGGHRKHRRTRKYIREEKNQEAGGRHKRSSRHRHKRSSRHRHKRSGKRSSRHRHKRSSHKRSSHKRSYKGGEFMGLNDTLNKSNPSAPPTSYQPVIDTSA